MPQMCTAHRYREAVTSLLVIIGTPIVLGLLCGLTVRFPVRERSSAPSA